MVRYLSHSRCYQAKELKIKMDECHARVNSIDGSNLTKEDQLRLLDELARIREQKLCVAAAAKTSGG